MPSIEELAASDPGTDLTELARLAHEHPELRASVAANPATYDGLLDWLGQFGDAEVTAAIARRRGGVEAPEIAVEAPAIGTYAATVGVSAARPLQDGAWHEPTQDLPLRWASYLPRYAAGLGLLTLGLALPATLIMAQAGLLVPLLIQGLLGVAGIVAMPTTIGRRVGAVGILLPILLGPILFYAAGFTSFIPVLGSLAIWLLLRQRSGLTYLLLIAAAVLGFVATYLTFVRAGDYRVALLISGALHVALVVGLAWLARLIEQRTAPARSRRREAQAQQRAYYESAFAQGYPQQPGYAPVTYAQPGYAGYPGHPGAGPVYARPGAPTNTMAILALVFGIGGGLLGIILGHMARAQIRRTGEAGWGLATVGMVLGYVGLGAAVLGLIGYIIFVLTVLN